MLRYIAVFLVWWFYTETVCPTRVSIEDNAYRGVLVALPGTVEEEEWPKIIQSVELMLRSSSVLLQMATKGRAYFSEVSFLLPEDLGDEQALESTTSFNSTTFHGPRAALTVSEADVVVTERGQYPYVLHQGGCGRKAMRIILPKDFLFRRKERAVVFARLWSEYRYGVFPEGGFQNDEKYPATYRTPNGDETRMTGCKDSTFWSSNLCHEGDRHCAANSMTSSLMDQHLTSASQFCEGSVSLGPKHNDESPSKHNLLCKGEGTWFTVMKSPDFARGKNAAPKYLQHATDVSFRFVQEAVSPKVIVAIEISSRMTPERRYALTQTAFYHFVYSILPYGSEVALFVFGGEEGVKLVKEGTSLGDEDSRILYVESQPLPEETSSLENVSLSELFDEIFFQTSEDDNKVKMPSPTVIVVTTESRINASTYSKVKQKISETESLLHVMLFSEDGTESKEEAGSASLKDLCGETGGEFLSLQGDPLGDLYSGFGKSIRDFNKDTQILQEYLKEETDLEVPFVVDESLAGNLKVYLFFPYSDADHLQFGWTLLQTPSGNVLNFMKLEFLSAWMVDLTEPEVGEYVLKTRRVEDVTHPVLMSVTGRAFMSEDPITVKVWAETLTDIQTTPRPVQIFAEVKKGWSPVRGAKVVATIHHPDGKMSELTLLDDGIGDVDVTKNDGIYTRYFTNFTAPGFYNLYVKVTQGVNETEVMIGPDGFCCGSSFTAVTAVSTGRFQRQAGPFTFRVPDFEGTPLQDRYPPSRITDLRLSSRYDRICVLHWTAVGDDFDSGSAKSYELKVFRDAAAIRNRFSNSGRELYSEVIESTPEAVYGTTLNHAFELPVVLGGGTYYVAVRAFDYAGNAGEPSNAVPVWIEESLPRVADCESETANCQNGMCGAMPLAERLRGNSAERKFSLVSYLVNQMFLFLFCL